MGPRDFSRGNKQAPFKEDRQTTQLQWGRVISHAETSVPNCILIQPTLLQWGRVISHAETPDLLLIPQRKRG